MIDGVADVTSDVNANNDVEVCEPEVTTAPTNASRAAQSNNPTVTAGANSSNIRSHYYYSTPANNNSLGGLPQYYLPGSSRSGKTLLPFAVSANSAEGESFLRSVMTADDEPTARYGPPAREPESENGSQIPMEELRQLTNDTFFDKSPPLGGSTPSLGFGRVGSSLAATEQLVNSGMLPPALQERQTQQVEYQSQIQEILNQTNVSADEVRSPVVLKRRPTLVTLSGGMPYLVDAPSEPNQLHTAQKRSSILRRRTDGGGSLPAHHKGSLYQLQNVNGSFIFGRDSITVFNTSIGSSTTVIVRENSDGGAAAPPATTDQIRSMLESSTNSISTTFRIRGSVVDIQLPKLSSVSGGGGAGNQFAPPSPKRPTTMNDAAADNISEILCKDETIFEYGNSNPNHHAHTTSGDSPSKPTPLNVDRVLSMLSNGKGNNSINRQGIATTDANIIVSSFSKAHVPGSNYSNNSRTTTSSNAGRAEGSDNRNAKVVSRAHSVQGPKVIPATAADVEQYLEEYEKQAELEAQQRRIWRLRFLVEERRVMVDDEHLVEDDSKLNLDEEDMYWPVFLTFLCVCVLIGVRFTLDRKTAFEGYYQLAEISLVFTGLFYMLSIVFRNVNQDYKEAEKIPMDIASSLRQILNSFEYTSSRFHTAWRKDVVAEMKKIEEAEIAREKQIIYDDEERERILEALSQQATAAFQPPAAVPITNTLPDFSRGAYEVTGSGRPAMNFSPQLIHEVESVASTISTSILNTPKASLCHSKVKTDEEDAVTVFLRENSVGHGAGKPLPPTLPPFGITPPTPIMVAEAPEIKAVLPAPPPSQPKPAKVFRPPIDANIPRVLVLQCAREALLTLRTDYTKPVKASTVRRRQAAGIMSDSKEANFTETSSSSDEKSEALAGSMLLGKSKRSNLGISKLDKSRMKASLARSQVDRQQADNASTIDPQLKYQPSSQPRSKSANGRIVRRRPSSKVSGGAFSSSDSEMGVVGKKEATNNNKGNRPTTGEATSKLNQNDKKNETGEESEDDYDDENGGYYYNPHGDCLSTLRELSILLNLWDRSTPSAVAPNTNNGLAYTNIAIDKARRMLNRATVIRRTDVLPAARALLLFFVIMACALILMATYKTDAGLFFVIAAVGSTVIFMARLIIKIDDPFLVKLHFMGNHTHIAREKIAKLRNLASQVSAALNLTGRHNAGGREGGSSNSDERRSLRGGASIGANPPPVSESTVKASGSDGQAAGWKDGERRLSFVPSHKMPQPPQRSQDPATNLKENVTYFLTFMNRLLFSERLAFVQDYPLVELIRELELEMEEEGATGI